MTTYLHCCFDPKIFPITLPCARLNTQTDAFNTDPYLNCPHMPIYGSSTQTLICNTHRHLSGSTYLDPTYKHCIWSLFTSVVPSARHSLQSPGSGNPERTFNHKFSIQLQLGSPSNNTW